MKQANASREQLGRVIDALRRRVRGDDEPESDAIELFKVVAQLSPESIAVIDVTGRFLYINREFEEFAPVEAGSSVWDYIDAHEHARTRACYEHVIQTRTASTYESTAIAQSGAPTVYRTHVGPIVVGDEVIALLIVADDTTHERDSDRALRESEEKLRFAIEASGMGIWSYDTLAASITLDERICAVAGLEPGGPRDLGDLAPRIPTGDRRVLLQALQSCIDSGDFEDVEHRVIRDDGTVVWLHTKGRSERDAHGNIVRIVGGSFDVTTQVEESERRDRAQKLEAVGQLAAGVAHNFNNALASIQLNLEVALRKTPDDVKPLLRDALEAGQRAAELVRDLLRFAGRGRKGDLREVESLTEVVDRVASLCRQTFSSAMSIDVRHGDDVPDSMLAVAQVEQMVLNLCINAQHALEVVHRERPTVTLETDALDASEPEVESRIGDERLASTYLRLRVTDNGCGMTEETLARLFEPFFTTKEPGRGTGLGEGTSFSVYIPARRQPSASTDAGTEVRVAAELAPQSMAPRSPLAEASATELLLVVDEDSLTRTAIARALRDEGYLVEELEGAAPAFQRIEAGLHGRAAQVDLLLLDRAIDDLTRTAVGERLRVLAAGGTRAPPSVLVVGQRDHGEGPASSRAARTELGRPVARRELLAAVRRALDAGATVPTTPVDGPGTSW